MTVNKSSLLSCEIYKTKFSTHFQALHNLSVSNRQTCLFFPGKTGWAGHLLDFHSPLFQTLTTFYLLHVHFHTVNLLPYPSGTEKKLLISPESQRVLLPGIVFLHLLFLLLHHLLVTNIKEYLYGFKIYTHKQQTLSTIFEKLVNSIIAMTTQAGTERPPDI